jgi:hypothetical protein
VTALALPCPWCGAVPTPKTRQHERRCAYTICCPGGKDCGFKLWFLRYSEADVIAAWNEHASRGRPSSSGQWQERYVRREPPKESERCACGLLLPEDGVCIDCPAQRVSRARLLDHAALGRPGA